MSHHVDDIRAALQQSPQVREAVAAMLAVLGEARECGVYSFTDTCDYEHTVETRFAKYQQAVDFERWVAIASKVVDKWIMESRDDDMDAKQTVAVQKAIGATHALVGIANGAEWRAYQQLETDTRRIVTERMAQTILDTLQQPPATEDSRLAAIARGIAETLKVYELPLSGALAFAYKRGRVNHCAKLNTPESDSFMESLRQLALWKAGQKSPTAPPSVATKYTPRITLITAAEYVEDGYEEKERRGECRVYWGTYGVNDMIGDMENGYAISFGAGGLATIDASATLTVVWLESANQPAEAVPVDALTAAQQRIAELQAEVALLQGQLDSAVRDADKRAFVLNQIRELVKPGKRMGDHTLDTIHAILVRTPTASPAAPESEATDGA